VDEHLADQLLLPLALAGGGSFRTTEPSTHSRTHADILGLFLPVRVGFEKQSGRTWRVDVRRSSIASTP
jgi:RNA 3'-terminal phosphate cyclase (ATP)